ncbi:M15 family metallopeptidase [Hymenobacter siberiensis]|uniref:M15 family metallopeptidase n=1 Tax=Hymenobacter siberiensis TaxID=2848396 RepID=UPI001C1DDC28|nr:M15 family metallopeptidase [Hymenobacter siberiensis]MBU6123178.1 M15 family metallopeptidase [Hymenobacter siberiensis]
MNRILLQLWLLCFLSIFGGCAVQPPHEAGPFQPGGLVELARLDPTIRLDIRYATTHNFMGRVLYPQARAFLQRPAAEALVRANSTLKPLGYCLLVFDGYRPWRITKQMWDHTPTDKKEFVADPQKGSRHNRGCAVDLSLWDMAANKEVAMPGEYDEMSPRSPTLLTLVALRHNGYRGTCSAAQWSKTASSCFPLSDGISTIRTGNHIQFRTCRLIGCSGFYIGLTHFKSYVT